jgi:hypothetical protein
MPGASRLEHTRDRRLNALPSKHKVWPIT